MAVVACAIQSLCLVRVGGKANALADQVRAAKRSKKPSIEGRLSVAHESATKNIQRVEVRPELTVGFTQNMTAQ